LLSCPGDPLEHDRISINIFYYKVQWFLHPSIFTNFSLNTIDEHRDERVMEVAFGHLKLLKVKGKK